MSTIKDVLEEFTFLYKPTIIICEWIPFGPNQFAHFCEALSAYRKDEIFITPEVDTHPETSLFRISPDYAWVKIHRFEEGKKVSFASRIFYPEESKVVQREEIGVSVEESGFTFYACRLTRCGGGGAEGEDISAEFASLDKLARIVADLLEDSSTLINSMLNSYQKRILSVIFPKSHEELYERKKVLCVMTTKVIYKNKDLRDHINSVGLDELLESYSDLREELQQILGYIMNWVQLPNNDIIIRGRDGFLILTIEENLEEYKEIMKIIMSLLALETFYLHLFSRVWMIWDSLNRIRYEISSEQGERPIGEYRMRLSSTLADTVILWDVDHLARFALGYLNKQISLMKEQTRIANENRQAQTIVSAVLATVNIDETLEVIKSKIEATKSILEAFRMDIDGLTTLIGTFMEKEMREIRRAMWRSIEKQTKIMEIEWAEKERLELIEFLSAGLLIAEILSLLFAWIEAAFGLTFGGWEYLFSIAAIFILAMLLRMIIRQISGVEELEATMK